MDLETGFSAEEQAQFDQMRAGDAAGSDGNSGSPATAPANTVEPTAATGEDKAGDGQAQPGQGQRMVPHGALHEERERRKEAEKRAQLLEERTNLILQRIGQPQASAAPATPAPEIPDIDKDPIGNIVGTLRQQGLNQQQILGALHQMTAHAQQQQAIAVRRQRAVADEREFGSANPDYNDAIAHLQASRHQELKALGVRDPSERQAIIERDAIQIADRAFATGESPAQILYDLAKLRGYAGKAAANDTARAAGEWDAAKNYDAPGAAAERIRAAQAGQEHARSLGNVRGAAPPPMTAQRLAEMTEAEFAKALESPEGLALMGA
jgi:hypothetical protein